MADKTFADGLIVKLPREGAPDYVLGSLSFKVAEFKAFLDKHEKVGGWVNVDLAVGKSGKPYASLNTYEAERPMSLNEMAGETPLGSPDDTGDAIPF